LTSLALRSVHSAALDTARSLSSSTSLQNGNVHGRHDMGGPLKAVMDCQQE
jgi:hypothetical protein